MDAPSKYAAFAVSGDRRSRLLAAAADVFSRRGFQAATVEEITRVAGVAKGSFYREFVSKDAIVVALKERFLDELGTRASAIASRLGSEDVWALADEFLVAMIDMHLEYRDLAAVLAREAPQAGNDRFATSDQRMTEMIVMGLRVGTATGAFKIEDPEMVAGLLMHGVQGLLHQMLLYEGEVDRDRILAAARHVMRRTLGAE